MKCEEVSKRVQDYIEGLLDPSQSESFQEHMGSCKECSRELHEFKRLLNFLGRLEREEVPQNFTSRVLEELQGLSLIKEQSSRKVPSIPAWIPPRLRVASTVLFVIVLAIFPLLRLWQSIKETLGGTAVWITDIIMGLRDSLEGVSFFYRLFEVLMKDLRTIRTLMETVSSLIWSSGEAYIIPGFMLLVVLLLFVAFLFRGMSKRRSYNASFCV